MTAWLIIGLVVAVLWAFWWWLGMLFDAISDVHAARRREDLSANKERERS